MGSSSSKIGPTGPKGDKGDKGDKGYSVTGEFAVKSLQALKEIENQLNNVGIKNRINNTVYRELFGSSNFSLDNPNITLKQENYILRMLSDIDNFEDFYLGLFNYIKSNPSVSNNHLIYRAEYWISLYTMNIPLDKTDMLSNSFNNFSQFITTMPEAERNIISTNININFKDSYKIIIKYLFDNLNLTQEEKNIYLKNYFLNLAKTSRTGTTQAFTNYSTDIDYSKISVNNRPYSIKQKITGSPISF